MDRCDFSSIMTYLKNHISESNANYAWILHILSHLKKTDGVAGFLLANGALNDSDTLEIRKELIQNDKIEAIVVLPRGDEELSGNQGGYPGQ